MSPTNERSAEWLRGQLAEARHLAEECEVVFRGDQPHVTRTALYERADDLKALLAAAEAREAIKLTKAQWVERYGGQAVLDREGFDVVPCVSCDDTICHGWRVTKKTEATQPTAAEVVAVADKALKRVVGLDYMGDPEVAIQSFPNLKVTPMQAAEELYELRSVIARWKEANGG